MIVSCLSQDCLVLRHPSTLPLWNSCFHAAPLHGIHYTTQVDPPFSWLYRVSVQLTQDQKPAHPHLLLVQCFRQRNAHKASLRGIVDGRPKIDASIRFGGVFALLREKVGQIHSGHPTPASHLPWLANSRSCRPAYKIGSRVTIVFLWT